MTVAVSPIATRYAGCHFRSRLEARWAVFFDRLGIDWEYEPQGFLVGMHGENLRPYLPDFFLHDLNLWVEVKGDEEDIDRELLLAAVLPWGGLPKTPTGPPLKPDDIPDDLDRMLLLGPIPRPEPGWEVLHSLLNFRRGIVYRNWASFSEGEVDVDWHIYMLDRFGGDGGQKDYLPLPLLETRTIHAGFDLPAFTAYREARSARFEHGQRGPT